MLISGQRPRSFDVATNQLIGKNIGIGVLCPGAAPRGPVLAKKDPVGAMADLNQVLVTRAERRRCAAALRGIVTTRPEGL